MAGCRYKGEKGDCLHRVTVRMWDERWWPSWTAWTAVTAATTDNNGGRGENEEKRVRGSDL